MHRIKSSNTGISTHRTRPSISFAFGSTIQRQLCQPSMSISNAKTYVFLGCNFHEPIRLVVLNQFFFPPTSTSRHLPAEGAADPIRLCEVITPHPRFLAFVANIRTRKGAKAEHPVALGRERWAEAGPRGAARPTRKRVCCMPVRKEIRFSGL